MQGEAITQAGIQFAFVRMKARLAGSYDPINGGFINRGDMTRTDTTTALHKGNHGA